MSDYVSILSKKEALRDPENINPSPDEDHPQGILKRFIIFLNFIFFYYFFFI